MPGSSSATAGVLGAGAADVDGAALEEPEWPACESAEGFVAESQPVSITAVVPRTATAILHRALIPAILSHAAEGAMRVLAAVTGKAQDLPQRCLLRPARGRPAAGTNSRPSATTAPMPCTAWGSFAAAVHVSVRGS